MLQLESLRDEIRILRDEIANLSDRLARREPDRLVSVREAAEILSLSRQAVYRLIEKGTLPSKKIGGAVRLSRRQLENYILH